LALAGPIEPVNDLLSSITPACVLSDASLLLDPNAGLLALPKRLRVEEWFWPDVDTEAWTV